MEVSFNCDTTIELHHPELARSRLSSLWSFTFYCFQTLDNFRIIIILKHYSTFAWCRHGYSDTAGGIFLHQTVRLLGPVQVNSSPPVDPVGSDPFFWMAQSVKCIQLTTGFFKYCTEEVNWCIGVCLIYPFHKASRRMFLAGGWSAETSNPWGSTASHTVGRSPQSSHSEAILWRVCVWTSCGLWVEWLECMKQLFVDCISTKTQPTCWVPAAGPRQTEEQSETSPAASRTVSGDSSGNT